MESSKSNLNDKPARKPRSDIGKKRKRYNQTVRASRVEDNALKAIVKDVEKFEARENKKDGESKSRAERKRQKRLQQIPNPRICPHCLKPKLKTKMWVLRNDFIGCKSCFWKLIIIPNNAKRELNNGKPINEAACAPSVDGNN